MWVVGFHKAQGSSGVSVGPLWTIPGGHVRADKTISIARRRWYGAGTMSGAPVELKVAGHTYRVVASAEKEVLHRLAAIVDAKVNEVTVPGRQVSPQAVLLAAISLAHELEEERAKRVRLEQRAREMFGMLLERVDEALEGTAALERPASVHPSAQVSQAGHDGGDDSQY